MGQEGCSGFSSPSDFSVTPTAPTSWWHISFPPPCAGTAAPCTGNSHWVGGPQAGGCQALSHRITLLHSSHCVSQAVGLPFSQGPEVTEVISGESKLQGKCERKHLCSHRHVGTCCWTKSRVRWVFFAPLRPSVWILPRLAPDPQMQHTLRTEQQSPRKVLVCHSRFCKVECYKHLRYHSSFISALIMNVLTLASLPHLLICINPPFHKQCFWCCIADSCNLGKIAPEIRNL